MRTGDDDRSETTSSFEERVLFCGRFFAGAVYDRNDCYADCNTCINQIRNELIAEIAKFLNNWLNVGRLHGPSKGNA